MNNRDHKNFAKDHVYHLYNRGNGRQDVFLDDEDRKFFLFRLKENLYPKTPLMSDIRALDVRHQGGAMMVAESHTPYARKELPSGSFSLLAYCLMPNHIHILLRQNTELSISKLMQKVFTSYGKYFNLKYDSVGHVFQDRIKAVLVDNDSYLTWISAYIHQNPKVAGLAHVLEDYLWSSYPDYIGKRDGTLCDKSLILGMFNDSKESYKQFVEESHEKMQERKDLGRLFLD